jgi:hypothetical protein
MWMLTTKTGAYRSLMWTAQRPASSIKLAI